MNTSDFEQWLKAYQKAWESRDSKAAARIFTEDCEYYWTPLDPPARGPAGVAAAWEGAVSLQRDVLFKFEILAMTGNTGIAKWRADFVQLPAKSKVRMEGVLTGEFPEPGKCRIFREWWHIAVS